MHQKQAPVSGQCVMALTQKGVEETTLIGTKLPQSSRDQCAAIIVGSKPVLHSACFFCLFLKFPPPVKSLWKREVVTPLCQCQYDALQGMNYLESRAIVHRDLAARNVLGSS